MWEGSQGIKVKIDGLELSSFMQLVHWLDFITILVRQQQMTKLLTVNATPVLGSI